MVKLHIAHAVSICIKRDYSVYGAVYWMHYDVRMLYGMTDARDRDEKIMNLFVRYGNPLKENK